MHLLAAVLLVGLAFQPWTAETNLPTSGHATYYAEGVMEAVAQRRIRSGQIAACPECVGSVAMMRKGDIGRKVWLEYHDSTIGPWLVVDCADVSDFQRVVQHDLIVEIPYDLAMKLQIRGPVPITVLPERPLRHRSHSQEH